MKFILLFFIFTSILTANNSNKISLQLQWKHAFQFAGYYIAKEKGYYKDAGIDLEIKEYSHGLNIADAVEKGDSTYGVGRPSIIIDKVKGKDIILLAAIYQSSPLAVLTTKKSGIKSIKDFKDKTIMTVSDSSNDAAINAMLKSQNLSLKDMNITKHSFDLKDLVDGKTDLITAYISEQPYRLEQLGCKPIIFHPKDYGFDFYSDILFTSNNELKKHPNRVSDFRRVSLKGWRYAFDNIEESVDLILRKYNTQNLSKEALIYEAKELKKLAFHNTDRLGKIEYKKVINILGLYNLMGVTHSDINFDDMVLNNEIINVGLTAKEIEYLKKHSTITVHNELDWAPYNYNKNGKPYGYSIDYMKLLASKIDMNIKFVSGYNWSQFINMIKNEKLDVMLNIVKTKNREKFLSYTTPYHEGINSVFVKENKAYSSLDQFNGKTLAVVKGFYQEELLKRFYPNIKLIFTSNSVEALKQVSFGKADGAIDNLATGNSIILQYGLTNIKPCCDVKDKRFKMDLHLATNKNNTILRDILEKAKQQITEYELRNMKQKWFLNNTKMVKNSISKSQFTIKQKEYLKNKKMITMCIDPDWMPFEKFNEKRNHIGLSKDYFDIFEQNLGIPIKPIYTKDWNQSLEFAKKRKCDILSLAMETKSRKEYMNFTKPYLTIPLVLATKMDVTYIDNMKQLENKKIGLVKGYALNETLKQKYPYLDIIEVESTDDGLQKVIDKKIFGFIGGVASIGYSFQKNFIGEIKISAKLDENWELGVAVRNDDPILFNIFENIIENLSQDTKQKIFNKYIAIKNDKRVDYTMVRNILIVVFIVILFFIYRQYVLKKSNIKLEKLQIIIKEKSLELQKNIDTMSKYIIYSRTDLKGIITQASDAFSDISQYSKEELIGKPHNIIRDPDMPKSAFKDMWQTIQSGQVWKGEVKNRKKDGSYYWVYAEISPEYDNSGDIKGYVAIRHDITANKNFEKQHKQLLQSEKLASMGEMIGNIAHQWRQPLAAIVAAASGMRLKKELGISKHSEEMELFDKITKSAKYLSKTIDDFGNFVKGERVKSIFQLSDLINSFLNLLDGTIKSNDIDVILDLDDNIQIDGYENELTQCLINIFNNAKDALVENKIENKLIFISSKTKDNMVIIKIKDNANGVPDEILDKVFEPYFTTKHQSQGTGLGLHMTYNLIVDGMNGTIEVYNKTYEYNKEEFSGAQFVITLPMTTNS